ncbi:MAG: hypothetical protein Tsb0010_05560 [Parvularculaceae bacterium]
MSRDSSPVSSNTSSDTRLPKAARRDKPLCADAVNALREAEARRSQASDPVVWPKEICGPRGAEPTRFGDWERKGIASDF